MSNFPPKFERTWEKNCGICYPHFEIYSSSCKKTSKGKFFKPL